MTSNVPTLHHRTTPSFGCAPGSSAGAWWFPVMAASIIVSVPMILKLGHCNTLNWSRGTLL
jgi:hypothetical protein